MRQSTSSVTICHSMYVSATITIFTLSDIAAISNYCREVAGMTLRTSS